MFRHKGIKPIGHGYCSSPHFDSLCRVRTGYRYCQRLTLVDCQPMQLQLAIECSEHFLKYLWRFDGRRISVTKLLERHGRSDIETGLTCNV